MLSKKDAKRIGSIGGHTTHSRHDSREVARRAHAGLEKKIAAEIDPEHQLPDEERARRIEQARRAYYQRLRWMRDHPKGGNAT